MWGGSICLTKAHMFYILPFTPTDFPHPTALMKIACLLITHLRAKAEMRRHPDLKNNPAIIVERSEGRSRVVDLTSSTPGVTLGMTLEEALSIHPDALVLDADESPLPQSIHPSPELTARHQLPCLRVRFGDGLCQAGGPLTL